MAPLLEETRRERLETLRLGMDRIAARLLLAARDGRPEDWRLLGRSAGRVERELTWYFNRIQDLEQLRLVTERCLDERVLEAQVKSAYLYAKAHGLGRFHEELLESKVAGLLTREPPDQGV